MAQNAQFISLTSSTTIDPYRSTVIFSCGGADRQINIRLPNPSTSEWVDGVACYIGNNDVTHSIDVYSQNSEFVGTIAPSSSMRIVFRVTGQRWWRG